MQARLAQKRSIKTHWLRAETAANDLRGLFKTTHPGEYAVAVIAYMTNWCPDCTRSRRVLQRAGVAFVEIDIDKIASAEDAMRAQNGGSGKVPTILIDGPEGRRVLIEPTDHELAQALNSVAVPV